MSVNDEVVHGIPGNRLLREGDIVSLDFGVIYQGFQADSAITIGVGPLREEAQRLLDTTQGALEAGTGEARAGSRLGDISAAIERYAESRGYSVVREYTGHGIGREMQEEPQVPTRPPPTVGRRPAPRPPPRPVPSAWTARCSAYAPILGDPCSASRAVSTHPCNVSGPATFSWRGV